MAGRGIKLNVPLRGATMPENKAVDPFKPAQPRIPGVSAPAEEGQEGGKSASSSAGEHSPGVMGPPPSQRFEDPSRLKLLWVGITLASALITGVLLFSSSRKAAPTASAASLREAPQEVAETPKARADIPDAQAPQGKVPMAPGRIATAAELAKPWAAKHFYFRDPVTSKIIPALVVHLPGGTYWGFSLREPFGSCDLEYVTDLKKLSAEYSFPASYPMVVDPCNKTVFDLMRYGNGPSGLVRGEIEQGSGWRPPIAIEIRTKGEEIVAVRTEQ